MSGAAERCIKRGQMLGGKRLRRDNTPGRRRRARLRHRMQVFIDTQPYARQQHEPQRGGAQHESTGE
jgi:hypothetical protein